MSNFEKIVVVVLVILFIGMGVLFYLQFTTNKTVENLSKAGDSSAVLTSKMPASENEDATINTLSNSAASDDEASASTNNDLTERIDELEATTTSLEKRIEDLEGSSGTTTVVKTTSSTAFQKQIIYIGSASTTKRDWTDSGVEVKLNSSDYPADVDVVFEVGLSIVGGGEAWARLVNKTTGAVMAITEISHSTSATTWKTSPSFKLYSGINTYALEVRSTSGEVANFSGARMVISK